MSIIRKEALVPPLKLPALEAHHTPTLTLEVKNNGCYASTPPRAFIACLWTRSSLLIHVAIITFLYLVLKIRLTVSVFMLSDKCYVGRVAQSV